MPFDCVIFDFDGLILDTESSWFRAWQDTFESFGGSLSLQEYSECIGTVGLEPIQELIRISGRPRIALEDDLYARAFQLALLERPRPGIRELCRSLDATGVPRAVASSSERGWVEDLLGSSGIDGWAHVACANGETSKAKPNAATYLEALAATASNPARSVAIEDSTNGVRAAKAAGLRCVAVPGPVTAHMDFSEADLVLATLEGVPPSQLLGT